jgi:hypothetical protein
MKPEPEGASEAKRMMMGPSALACGEDTAPGSKNALAARSKMKGERSVIDSTVREMKEKSIRFRHVTRHADTGTPLADTELRG